MIVLLSCYFYLESLFLKPTQVVRSQMYHELNADFLPFFQSLVFMPFLSLLNIFNSTFKVRIY